MCEGVNIVNAQPAYAEWMKERNKREEEEEKKKKNKNE